jgi:hypothetical protein
MMVLLKAVGALDHQNSKNDLSVCTHYGLRPKAMTEIRKIRRQLIQIGKISFRKNSLDHRRNLFSFFSLIILLFRRKK